MSALTKRTPETMTATARAAQLGKTPGNQSMTKSKQQLESEAQAQRGSMPFRMELDSLIS